MKRDPVITPVGSGLDHLLSAAGLTLLEGTRAKFDDYLALILHWNSKLNLTSIRDPEEILRRHFVESIACACYLPEGIGSLLDFGSGGGFPGIPIALCRPEVTVTLAESQTKKAAFLHEAVRVLALDATIFAGRAEQLRQKFSCVTLRAVDRMEQAIAGASSLVENGGRLAVMTTRPQVDLIQKWAGSEFTWIEPWALPGSEQRVLTVGVKGDPLALM